MAGTQWRDVGAIVAVDVAEEAPPARLTPPDGASWTLLDSNAGKKRSAARPDNRLQKPRRGQRRLCLPTCRRAVRRC